MICSRGTALNSLYDTIRYDTIRYTLLRKLRSYYEVDTVGEGVRDVTLNTICICLTTKENKVVNNKNAHGLLHRFVFIAGYV